MDELNKALNDGNELGQDLELNSASDEWQRLSPISILYFTVRSLFLIANNFIYLVPIVAVNFSTFKDQPLLVVFIVLALLMVLALIGFLQFLFYRFRVQGQRVEIKQGVIKKSHIDLPFERIQNVKLEQPLYYRFNNFACVELDTAGSAKQEAKIIALKMDLAQAFRKTVIETNYENKLNEEQGNEGQVESASSAPAVNEVELNRRSMKDLVIHGVSNNRVWIFLGALAPFYASISDALSQLFVSIGFDVEAYFSIQTLAWWEFALHVLSLAMLLMLIIVLFSVVGSILMFYGYTLCKSDDRYIRRSGLLTKQEVSMKQSRIQLMVQQQDWLDILLKRVNLYFEQNKTGSVNQNQPGQHLANKLLVPSVTPQESAELMHDVMPEQALPSQNFAAISKRFILKNAALFALPLAGLIGATLQHKNDWGWLAGLGIFAFFIAIITLRWWRWGYSFDSDFAYIRKGFLGVNYYCFPINKVQQIHFKQNSFMRPYKLATLRVVLASGALSVPYMDEYIVRKQINRVLDVLVSDKRSWM
ncbi:PH domain-containing protein [Glaciecola sp. MH2013]|uniref:PH domain-containing protein n=1 Tax=Glaciecola sp. MH2013 TaxID=2785524 RepID=UPI00189D47BF|nr:PH domain-containing protein [Glaciecola sp. MH2013]MBF7074859.1 PH domain-containing protein [Glaciecola sp. MH2013]